MDSSFGEKTLKAMSKHSPLSMTIVFEQIKRGKSMSLADVLVMEYQLCQGFMNNPEFFEGVRALLVDKDNAPKWSHKTVEDVKSEELDHFFKRKEALNLDYLKP